ncbi:MULTISPECIES: conjugal transfer protein TraN [unclassified Novosphingobium]|uniref:conjugal transfer protein TraN n=1 Tax=unclassified Novosphingobium TaxID=2644732 RepID=UPI000D2FC759|nr:MULTISPECIES: conjugal transfer protein TraN [unclassified Novosphingobium]PTR12610.1 conjugal transfer mating pair stabilization protein TraN [Novosphingobium sp. GV055]PUB06394.1 conjugal transfer mating pair stabilization protein TraN [Novosphingobium sp. GV061]PUB22445.1 conjugal transfer mating pair stabilization protein TraN [Novosphingobium sp. GV079]PUB44470.1 conjugal transfer mating pair stabilization protein TraN [Novosphingobium sp. GV027]
MSAASPLVRRLLPALLAASCLTFGIAPSARAQEQQLCAADLNGNGDAADPGEIASCTAMQAGSYLCPLQRTDCVADALGAYSCPLGTQYQCLTPVAGGTPACSPNACAPVSTAITTPPVVDDPGAPNDGASDAAGNCYGAIEIFSGRALRCRPPGLLDTFSNCCRNRGTIVKDGMGSSLGSLSTKIAVAKGVISGMQAAYAAFQAGSSASEAASAGAGAIIGIDPTSLAISLAVNLVIEFLLSGCDSQDMEAGILRGSGMCHEVGSYCSSSILGICIQKSVGNCCFNTKLGRIIQEQGRPQLKSFNAVGWGTPKAPYCRGFTPEEFQALDFSKMDLSEYYSDIASRAQSDIQIDMKDKIDAYMQTVKP